MVVDAMGAHGLCWTAGVGVTIAGFEPHVPPVVPTADNVLSTAVAARATLMFLTPLFIEVSRNLKGTRYAS